MIAVWFSCGAASAVAAKKTIERYGQKHEVRILNTPLKEEDEDNRRFLKDVQEWLGLKIDSVVHSKWPNSSAREIWDKYKFMSAPHGAECTRTLKKGARQRWEREHKPEFHVLGFTLDEKSRHERFVQTERENVLPVLIDAKITKANCFEIIRAAGIKLPRVYAMGYPNANCIGCVKATSPTYWNLVRKAHPKIFQDRAKQSREIGARLVRMNGERIFLDELDPNAKGRKMKSWECGIFCEEK